MVGLLLITIGHGFVTHQFDLEANLPAVGLAVLVWLLGGAIAVAEGRARIPDGGGKRSWMGLLVLHLLVSGACLLVFLPVHMVILGRFPDVAGIASAYYVAVFVLLLVTAVALLGRTSPPRRFWRPGNSWTYAVFTGLVVFLVIRTNLHVVKGDIYFRLGRVYQQAEQWESSLAAHQQATYLVPRQARYHVSLGQAYLKQAQPRTARREDWLRRAEGAFQRAVEINPLNPDYQGDMGNMYHAWADVTGRPVEKAERLTKALFHYQQSVQLAPQTHSLLLKEALFDAHLGLADCYAKMGDIDGAIREAEAATDWAPAGKIPEVEDFIAQLKALWE
jgi:hypothetical protein